MLLECDPRNVKPGKQRGIQTNKQDTFLGNMYPSIVTQKQWEMYSTDIRFNHRKYLTCYRFTVKSREFTNTEGANDKLSR